jgi:hypothetical protein
MRMNKKFFSFWSDTKISKSRCMPSERREEVDGRRKCRKQKQRVKVGTVGIVNGKQLWQRGWKKVRAFLTDKVENLKAGMWKIEEVQRTCRFCT